MTNEFLEAALTYASLGWRVFPLRPRSKDPATRHGFKDATTDVRQIKSWWTANPNYNVAIATGNGLTVIDVDDKPEKHPYLGSDVLRDWEFEHGKISETVTAMSGTGGAHYYYDTAGWAIPKCESPDLSLDLRGEGGYIVAPPSIHPETGEPYMWDISPEDMEPTAVNATDKACIQWIYDNRIGHNKASSKEQPKADANSIEPIPDGQRNATLFSIGRSLLAKGATKEEILERLSGINLVRCKPPYPQEGIVKIVESVCSKEPGFSEEVKSTAKGTSNTRFNHAKVAKKMISENHACFIDGVPAVMIDGRYQMGWEAVNKAVLLHHETASSTNRKEVREYLALTAPQVQSSPPNLIGFANGVLDINTMQLREYTPSDIIQNVIPHDWNPYAESPLVDETLRKLSANDPIIELNLTEFMGLCLYRSGDLAYFPILLGKKGKNASNGKSTYIKMVRSMLGNGNCSSLSFNDLGQQFLKRYIAGKLANLGDDISAKQIDSNALETVKKAAAGDRVFCDVKNGGAFEFDSYCTFIFSANRMPSFESEDDGLNRRMFPLRFNARFTRDDPDFDPRISKKLEGETACQRMLVRAVDGLKRCIANDGPTPNKESRAMLEDIKEANNSIIQWMRDVDRDSDSFIGCQPTPLFEAYREWCSKSGIKNPYGKPGFGKMLVELFGIESYVKWTDGQNQRLYRRIED